MNKQEIKQLILKIHGKPIPVYFIKGAEGCGKGYGKYKYFNSMAAVVDNHHIVINKNRWRTIQKDQQIAVLLHEIGHLNDPTSSLYSTYKRHKTEAELNAQVWAINKAKALEWHDIAFLLIITLDSWGRYRWNSCQRKYLLAYRLAQKRGIVTEPECNFFST